MFFLFQWKREKKKKNHDTRNQLSEKALLYENNTVRQTE